MIDESARLSENGLRLARKLADASYGVTFDYRGRLKSRGCFEDMDSVCALLVAVGERPSQAHDELHAIADEALAILERKARHA